MEGRGGIATYSHVMMQGVEYERARQWMTGEANACIEIAFLTSAMADMAELIPGTRRSGPRSVGYASRDYLELYRALLALVRIAPAAVPPEQS